MFVFSTLLFGSASNADTILVWSKRILVARWIIAKFLEYSNLFYSVIILNTIYD